MQNNNPNDYLQEDEIDLKEIFNLLINSKKLIISITLIITILGAIYSFQKETEYKSTALIEIGNYGNAVLFTESRGLDSSVNKVEYNQESDGILIEPAITLIQELTINFIHKQGNNLSLNSFENRLINIAHTSTSSVTSKNLLNEIIEYIENRHSLMLINRIKKTKNLLTFKIESLDNKINELKNIILEDLKNLKLLESNPDLLIQRVAQSPTLNQVIHSYNIQLLDLESEKDNLQLELEFLMQQYPTKTQLVGEILTSDIPINERIILLSFIFGLFLSIVMVFINNSFKALKE
jgi:capsular polysaccharide biosynthesis protein